MALALVVLLAIGCISGVLTLPTCSVNNYAQFSPYMPPPTCKAQSKAGVSTDSDHGYCVHTLAKTCDLGQALTNGSNLNYWCDSCTLFFDVREKRNCPKQPCSICYQNLGEFCFIKPSAKTQHAFLVSRNDVALMRKHWLVIPYSPVTGVESVIKLSPTPPFKPPKQIPDTLALDRLWWYGWNAATVNPPALPWGEKTPPAIPSTKLGLVINSAKARDQHQVDMFHVYAGAYYSNDIQPSNTDWPGPPSAINPAYHTTILLARAPVCWCVPKGTACKAAKQSQLRDGWVVYLLQGIGDADILAY